jgi:CDP-6-deoxy-D-xylo-4-hexulose-3-dehydrase|tara:strand:+ start:832 stop:2007 length:1176 start_codon:yes stop_codon:yes gene_type:complete
MKKIMYKLSEDTFDNKEFESVKNLFIKNQKLTYGNNVIKLENKIAKIHNRKYCLMVNSGSSANLLGVAALIYDQKFDLRYGDEVIVPSMSWSTTYSPLIQYGLKLVFVDIDEKNLNININLIEKAITKKTKAIFAVNILGQSCNYTELKKISKKYNLLIMEDNCESFMSAHKKKIAGSFGIFSSLSSYFSHHFSTIEGGYLLTDNFKLYCTGLSLRSHGWAREQPKNSYLIKKKYSNFEKKFKFHLPGYNLRPTEVAAVIGLEQLKKIKKFINNRKKNANFFYKIFSEGKNYTLQKYDKESSHFGFAIILKNSNRAQVVDQMDKIGIETRPIISGNFINNPVLKFSKYRIGSKMEIVKKIDTNGFMIGNRSNLFTKVEKNTLIKLRKLLDD